MGTSIGMIDRHHGHLARDGRGHAIRLIDAFIGGDVHVAAVAWSLE